MTSWWIGGARINGEGDRGRDFALSFSTIRVRTRSLGDLSRSRSTVRVLVRILSRDGSLSLSFSIMRVRTRSSGGDRSLSLSVILVLTLSGAGDRSRSMILVRILSAGRGEGDLSRSIIRVRILSGEGDLALAGLE